MDKETKLETSSTNSIDLNQNLNLAAQIQLLQQNQLLEQNVVWPNQELQMMILPNSSTISNNDFVSDAQNVNQQNLNLLQLIETNLTQRNDSNLHIANLDQNILNSNEIKVIDSSLLQQIFNLQQNSNSSNAVTNQASNSLSTATTALTQKPRSYTRPPKKPLTPYMIFSKQIWPQVKKTNPHLSSVCEIGSIVGSLWRDLSVSDKEVYNELFVKDKERYDTELREYLQMTGLNPSSLPKPRIKRSVSTPKNNPNQTISQITANLLVTTGSPTNAQSANPILSNTTTSNILINSNTIESNNSSNSNVIINNNAETTEQQTILVQSDCGTFSLDAALLLNLLNMQQQNNQPLQLQPSDLVLNLNGNDLVLSLLNNPDQLQQILQQQPTDQNVTNIEANNNASSSNSNSNMISIMYPQSNDLLNLSSSSNISFPSTIYTSASPLTSSFSLSSSLSQQPSLPSILQQSSSSETSFTPDNNDLILQIQSTKLLLEKKDEELNKLSQEFEQTYLLMQQLQEAHNENNKASPNVATIKIQPQTLLNNADVRGSVDADKEGQIGGNSDVFNDKTEAVRSEGQHVKNINQNEKVTASLFKHLEKALTSDLHHGKTNDSVLLDVSCNDVSVSAIQHIPPLPYNNAPTDDSDANEGSNQISSLVPSLSFLSSQSYKNVIKRKSTVSDDFDGELKKMKKNKELIEDRLLESVEGAANGSKSEAVSKEKIKPCQLVKLSPTKSISSNSTSKNSNPVKLTAPKFPIIVKTPTNRSTETPSLPPSLNQSIVNKKVIILKNINENFRVRPSVVLPTNNKVNAITLSAATTNITRANNNSTCVDVKSSSCNNNTTTNVTINQNSIITSDNLNTVTNDCVSTTEAAAEGRNDAASSSQVDTNTSNKVNDSSKAHDCTMCKGDKSQ